VPNPVPWEAERIVTAEQATSLVAGAFPALRGLPVRQFAEGWDNTVLLVDETWAFRFPRRAVTLPAFRRESAVLPQIAPLLPLPIPVPELIGTDDDPADPWPFTGARLIPGQELADALLADDARVDAASAVGAFLRALHAPTTRTAVNVELPRDPMHRGHPQARMQSTRETLDQLVTSQVWTRDPAVDTLLADADRLGPPTGEPVLVHGDLHARHLLVDAAGRASGVIDWGDVCLADPAVDLSLAYAAFAGPARAALLAQYGTVGPDQELRARALALRISAFLAAYAAAEDRPPLLAEARAALHRAVT
jgi:aminoglycoside phosphotransferase (APT) family kinase protein